MLVAICKMCLTGDGNSRYFTLTRETKIIVILHLDSVKLVITI